jgi:hypothetical protein
MQIYFQDLAYQSPMVQRNAPITYPAAPVPPTTSIISSSLPNEAPAPAPVVIPTATNRLAIEDFHALPTGILHPIISTPNPVTAIQQTQTPASFDPTSLIYIAITLVVGWYFFFRR